MKQCCAECDCDSAAEHAAASLRHAALAARTALRALRERVARRLPGALACRVAGCHTKRWSAAGATGEYRCARCGAVFARYAYELGVGWRRVP